MAVLYTTQGQLVDVPDDKVEAALASGDYHVPSPEDVEKKFQAKLEGYREERLGGTANELTAGTFEVAKEFSGGLSDVALRAVGGARGAQWRKDLSAQNPVASGIGTAIGVVGGVALGTKAAATPIGLAMQAGKSTESLIAKQVLKSVVGKGPGAARAAKILSSGAGAAAEGGLYGLTEGVSDVALEEGIGDPSHVAELILSKVIQGGVYGGAFGAGLPALGGILGKTSDKTIGALGRRLHKTGNPADKASLAVLEAAGLKPGQAAKLRREIIEQYGASGEAKYDRFVKHVLEGDENFAPILRRNMKPQEAAEAIFNAVDDAGNKLKGFYARAEGHKAARIRGTQLGERLAKVREKWAPQGVSRAGHLSNDAVRLLNEWGGRLPDPKKMNRFGRIIKSEEAFTPNKLGGMIDELENVAYTDRIGRFRGTDKELAADFAKVFRDVRDEMVKRTQPADYAAFRTLKDRFADMAPAMRTMKRQMDAEGAAGVVGRAGKYVARAAAWRGVGALGATGKASAVAGIAAAAPQLAISAGVMYGGMKAFEKLTNKANYALKMSKLAKSGKMSEWVDRMDARLGAAADAAKFKKKVGRGISLVSLSKYAGAKDDDEAVEKMRDHLARLSADPNYAAQIVDSELAGVDEVTPAAAEEARFKMMEAASMLSSALQGTATQPNPLQPMLDTNRLTDEQMGRAREVMTAMQDPIQVMENAADGVVTPKQAEIVRNLYPTLIEEFKTVVTMTLQDHPTQIAYEKQVALSVLFGEPVTATMNQQFLERQATVHMPPQGGAPTQGGLNQADDLGASQQLGFQRASGNLTS